MQVERGKSYRLHLDGFDQWVLMLPIEDYSKEYQFGPQNFRYQFKLNYWGHTLNQFSCDYINDRLQYDEPIAYNSRDNKLKYAKILRIVEIQDSHSVQNPSERLLE